MGSETERLIKSGQKIDKNENEIVIVDKKRIVEKYRSFQSSKEDDGIQPLALKWNQVTVTAVSRSGEGQQILDRVSGVAEAGKMLAIMGASGAGKSTLLDTLFGRLNRSQYDITGSIKYYLNTKNKLSSLFLRPEDVGYVHQDDIFVNTLTPEEHLTFYSNFIFRGKKSKKEISNLVEIFLMKLRLNKCKNTIIGSASGKKGLSGGEKKRLSFASALIRTPKLLFADEPTTGLDSNSSLDVVRFLSELGTTVVCTIHQPSNEVLNYFQNILLLAEGGRVAFFGSKQHCLNFFTDLGNPCPNTWNPGDFFVHAVAIVPFQEESSRMRLNQICAEFEARSSVRKVRFSHEVDGTQELVFDVGSKSPSNSFWSELSNVFHRTWLDSIRNAYIHRARFFQKVFVATLIALMFSWIDLNNPNQNTVQSVQGVLFIYLCESSYPCLYGFLYEFPKDLPLGKRELSLGFYRPVTFYFGKIFSFLPGVVAEVVITTSIFYFIVGLHVFNGLGYLVTMAVGFVCSVISLGVGSLFGLLFVESPSLSGSSVGVFSAIVLIFGGFYLSESAFPSYIGWMKYFSWFYYSFRILCKFHWYPVGEIISCSHGGNETVADNTTGCLRSGQDVLENLSMEEIQILPSDIAGLASLLLIYHLGAFLILRYKIKQ